MWQFCSKDRRVRTKKYQHITGFFFFQTFFFQTHIPTFSKFRLADLTELRNSADNWNPLLTWIWGLCFMLPPVWRKLKMGHISFCFPRSAPILWKERGKKTCLLQNVDIFFWLAHFFLLNRFHFLFYTLRKLFLKVLVLGFELVPHTCNTSRWCHEMFKCNVK